MLSDLVELLSLLSKSSEPFIVAISILAALFSVIGAIRSGALRSIRVGSLEIKASGRETEEARDLIHAVSTAVGDRVPFETEQLANYYSQVLAQSKISFWFSLVFASVGFLIIVLAAFMRTNAEAGSTIARFVAGGVVDTVAALFFVQSKRAQEAMAEFFDKLRRDRNHAEARKLCESLDTAAARDALRVRLSLHYAEVEAPDSIAEAIMKTCLQGVPAIGGAA